MPTVELNSETSHFKNNTIENVQYTCPYIRLRQKPLFTSILTKVYQRLHITSIGDIFLTTSRYKNYIVLGCAAV